MSEGASAEGYETEQLRREQHFVESDAFTASRYAHFAKQLSPDFSGEVLDVGCGLGVGGEAFKRHRPHATIDGNELVPARVERMPSGVYRRVISGLVQDMASGSNYDVVLAGEVIEHVPVPHVDSFLTAVRRQLRPGGTFMLTTPNPHYILLKRRSGGSVLGGAHVSVHCRATLAQYLASKGFVIEAVAGSGKMTRFFGRRAPSSLYGAFFIKARVAGH